MKHLNLTCKKRGRGLEKLQTLKKTKGQIKNALNVGEDIINENNKIAEQCNNHFWKIVETIENQILKAKNPFNNPKKIKLNSLYPSIPQYLRKSSFKSNI